MESHGALSLLLVWYPHLYLENNTSARAGVIETTLTQSQLEEEKSPSDDGWIKRLV